MVAVRNAWFKAISCIHRRHGSLDIGMGGDMIAFIRFDSRPSEFSLSPLPGQAPHCAHNVGNVPQTDGATQPAGIEGT